MSFIKIWRCITKLRGRISKLKPSVHEKSTWSHVVLWRSLSYSPFCFHQGSKLQLVKPWYIQLSGYISGNLDKVQCFLAATKQLYEWYFLSVCPSVCPFVRLSHLFDYVPIILPSWNFQELLPMWVRSKQKVKVRGQRSRSQRSQPNLTVSGL